MTVEEQHTGASHDERRDLALALRAATELQATIRLADAKAKVILSMQGGMAVVVLDRMPSFHGMDDSALLTVAGIVATSWLAGLAVSAWHLLFTIIPRLGGHRAANRFAFPRTRPSTAGLREQRNEAWDQVSALADIAVAKHRRVQRCVPGLVVATTSAGALLVVSFLEVLTR